MTRVKTHAEDPFHLACDTDDDRRPRWVQQLQSDLAQWQQTAEDNRADLSGADLSDAYLYGADLSDVVWYDTTCPDGTNSDDNGDTCENNL